MAKDKNRPSRESKKPKKTVAKPPASTKYQPKSAVNEAFGKGPKDKK